jgi:hypothetical protein
MAPACVTVRSARKVPAVSHGTTRPVSAGTHSRSSVGRPSSPGVTSRRVTSVSSAVV